MTYLHSDDRRIQEFIRNTLSDTGSLQAVCRDLLAWFDQTVAYSRLNAPFFPLQRSDLEVLVMHAGTCGDYANLLVSVFQTLGYEAAYGYVRKDCYGDVQDHICAAVRSDGRWILIDATQPYRKWHGFDCPHREYDLLLPDEFEQTMKQEEQHWIGIANRYGNEALAGLLYAPWIHEEILRQSEHLLESVFFLLSVNGQADIAVYAYLQRYSRDRGFIPIMSTISGGRQTYCFSCKTPQSIWDQSQWSEEYPEEEIPDSFRTDAFSAFQDCVSRVLPKIYDAISLT